MEGLRAIFQGVEDPCESNAKKHDLIEMLVTALLATLAGMSSCSSFARYARVKYALRSGCRFDLWNPTFRPRTRTPSDLAELLIARQQAAKR